MAIAVSRTRFVGSNSAFYASLFDGNEKCYITICVPISPVLLFLGLNFAIDFRFK